MEKCGGDIMESKEKHQKMKRERLEEILEIMTQQ